MRCCASLRTSSPNPLLWLFLAAVLAFGEVRIVLKPSASKALRLQDVAAIEAPDPLGTYLASIRIDPSYRSDGLLTKEELYHILRKNFVDTDAIEVVGGPVALRSKPLAPARLEEAIRSYVKDRYDDLQIARISMKRFSPMPPGTYRIRIRESSATFGHLYLKASIFEGDRLLESVPVTVKVIRFANRVVAKRDIPKGKVIAPEDLETKRMRRYSSMESNLGVEEVVGSVARRVIQKGTLIRPSMLEPRYEVKRKDRVRVLYQKGAIRIEIVGVALDNGKKGDIIRVKNLSSGKVLRCKVLSRGSALFVP